MPNPNLYVPSWPLTHREYQNLVDRVNYLTMEVDRMRGGIPDPGARKENPQPGVITIPSPTGDGFIRVNSDGTIVSYTNPSLWVAPKSIITFSGDLSTTSTTEVTLVSGVVPGGTMEIRDQIQMLVFGYSTGNPIGTFTSRIRLGGVLLAEIVSTAGGTFQSYNYYGIATRIDSTNIRGDFSAVNNGTELDTQLQGAALNFAQDNTLAINGFVTGGTTPSVVVRATMAIKHPAA